MRTKWLFVLLIVVLVAVLMTTFGQNLSAAEREMELGRISSLKRAIFRLKGGTIFCGDLFASTPDGMVHFALKADAKGSVWNPVISKSRINITIYKERLRRPTVTESPKGDVNFHFPEKD